MQTTEKAIKEETDKEIEKKIIVHRIVEEVQLSDFSKEFLRIAMKSEFNLTLWKFADLVNS